MLGGYYTGRRQGRRVGRRGKANHLSANQQLTAHLQTSSLLQASRAWRTEDTGAYTVKQQADQDSASESTHAWLQQELEVPVQFATPPEDAAGQEPEAAAAQEPDTVAAQEPEDTAGQKPEDAAAQEPDIVAQQPMATEQEQLVETDTDSLPAGMETTYQALSSATASNTTRQDQKDRTAATLSKELRKLQAETTVLQEHSRRLQEKAAVIQQQRTADQASLCCCLVQRKSHTLHLYCTSMSLVVHPKKNFHSIIVAACVQLCFLCQSLEASTEHDHSNTDVW